jgi:hypothetical protein
VYAGSNDLYASAVEYNITMGIGADTYTQSWETPTDGVIAYYNALYVVGCGVDVYVFGDNATDFIGSCMSICGDNREIMDGMEINCQGLGCCAISIPMGLQAFTFKLGRCNSSTIAQSDEALSSIKVIISREYEFVIDDLYASWVNTTNVDGMYLKIAITDQPSCASAQSQVNKEDTYACNSESICYDHPALSRGGYYCYCPGQSNGNPYVAGGCIEG